MNKINLNNDTINAINYLKTEAETLSLTYDLHITYIITIFIIGETETPIKIIMKCTRNWPLSVLIERLERVFNTSMSTMKFMTNVNNNYTLLEQSKMLKEYHNILKQSNYTIYLSKS